MRKTAIFLLIATLLSACNAQPTQPLPTEPTENTADSADVTVNFLSAAEAWDTAEVVNAHKDYYLQHEPDYMKADPTLSEEEYLLNFSANEMLQFWKVGTIENGTYADQSLVLAKETCDGPCAPNYFRYAVDEATDTWTNLLPYSDELSDSFPGGPAPDQEASIMIPALEVPDQLEVYNDDGVFLMDARSGLDPTFYGEEESNSTEPTAIQDPAFKKYLASTSSSCLYGVTPDGVLVRYLVTPSVFGVTEGSNGDLYSPVTTENFPLELSTGKIEDHEYSLFAGGCGFASSCIMTQKPTATEEAKLKKIGTVDGRNIYMLDSVEEKVERPDTATLTGQVQNAYNNYKMGAEYKDPPVTPVSLTDYLAQHNVVFFKFENGTYTLAYDTSVAPSVECGKPVIYLYPTAAQKVSVKVNNIAFTKTVPAHGQKGWTVWATPNGTLKNLADGLTYPYLFWEGQSSARVAMNEGWTLAKKDVATKLPTALASMGLNTKETADFMEFWLPRLQAVNAPYIQFNFEGTAAMNQVAPLTITPEPDTVLRVFMYYQGVGQPGLSMPTYTAPTRSGFTVIEWGGSLY